MHLCENITPTFARFGFEHTPFYSTKRNTGNYLYKILCQGKIPNEIRWFPLHYSHIFGEISFVRLSKQMCSCFVIWRGSPSVQLTQNSSATLTTSSSSPVPSKPLPLLGSAPHHTLHCCFGTISHSEFYPAPLGGECTLDRQTGGFWGSLGIYLKLRTSSQELQSVMFSAGSVQTWSQTC